MMRNYLGMAAVTAALAFSATPSIAALAVGAKAPDFTTRGAKAGKVFTVHLAEALKKGPVVLYFFPKAFTKGCTAETHEFADKSAEFAAAGATIIGMSNDDVPTLVKFSTEACRDKFAVASAGPDIVKSFDVAMPTMTGMTDRTSYVIAKSGNIAFVHSEMDYKQHVALTLDAVKSLKNGK